VGIVSNISTSGSFERSGSGLAETTVVWIDLNYSAHIILVRVIYQRLLKTDQS